jgi:hypothetical protein
MGSWFFLFSSLFSLLKLAGLYKRNNQMQTFLEAKVMKKEARLASVKLPLR